MGTVTGLQLQSETADPPSQKGYRKGNTRRSARELHHLSSAPRRARSLLNQRISREFIEDAQAYYAALAAADQGDLKPLEDRIKAALQ